MSEITDLSAAVAVRYGAQFLKEMTNPDDSAATTVDSTRLDAASADCIGAFQLETGVTFSAANSSHLYLCIGGVMAMLEKFKSRDAGIMSKNWNNFLGACLSFRKKSVALPISNSMYNAYRETVKTRPDMDRDQPAFSGRRNLTVKETN